jgi:hypothetical protein
MNFVKIILVVSMLIFQVAHGQCTNIDIRDKNPKLAEFFSKPRDQDSIGWCYGFAAADLLSVEAGVPVSAMHTSAIFNKKISNSFFWNTVFGFQHKIPKFLKDYFFNYAFSDIYEGGLVSKALNGAQDEGFICSEAQMPFDSDYRDQVGYLILSLEELKSQVKNNVITFENFCDLAQMKLYGSKLSNADLAKLYQAMLKDQLNQGLEEMMSETCAKDKIRIPKFKIQKIFKPSITSENEESERNNYFKKIGEVLEVGKPLAISYNVKHVLNPPANGGHVSVLTARRWNPINNKCEYKIRNSIGQSCAQYLPYIDCNLEEGSIWVNEDKFYEMVNDIDYISNK